MTVISIENLSKIYRLGQIGTGTFTNDLKVWWAKWHGKPNPISKIGEKTEVPYGKTELWALRDISFTVSEGEVLGIIGGNGAGKSTLLKILSRVTAPTSGKVKIKGRIASLLEVGTGFHPELTGRENTYLNGAILGMARKDIDRKFDEIVEFAEVGKFIDTPVKRYSSGMYVRLAFAVAAHLDPEILVVDEVLAVGDAVFQKKCLGKMDDVSRSGRAVLFVSHNMTAVQSLCQHAIQLDEGRLVGSGTTHAVISGYLRNSQPDRHQVKWDTPETAPGNDVVRIHNITVASDCEDELLTMQIPLKVETTFWVLKSGITTHITYHLINDLGVIVLTTGTTAPINQRGHYRSSFRLPANLLNSGRYFLKMLVIQDGNRVTHVNENIASFTIHDVTERDSAWMGREPGAVHLVLPWQVEKDTGNF